MTNEELRDIIAKPKRKVATSWFGNNTSTEWYTPSIIIEAARKAMGNIDLDPTSSDYAQATVKADRYFTKEDDGLTKEWSGKVFMNPPFSPMTPFILKFLTEPIEQGVVLCIANFHCNWGRALLLRDDVMFCAPYVCPQFYNEEGTKKKMGMHSIIIVGYKTDKDRFRDAFSEMGRVYG